MECVRFLSKAKIVCSREEEKFDCKNNYGRVKLANLKLDNFGKINCRTLVILSYILLGLGLKKI